jgi:hypothetical protein
LAPPSRSEGLGGACAPETALWPQPSPNPQPSDTLMKHMQMCETLGLILFFFFATYCYSKPAILCPRPRPPPSVGPSQCGEQGWSPRRRRAWGLPACRKLTSPDLNHSNPLAPNPCINPQHHDGCQGTCIDQRFNSMELLS